jgi:hypothetical protein
LLFYAFIQADRLYHPSADDVGLWNGKAIDKDAQEYSHEGDTKSGAMSLGIF